MARDVILRSPGLYVALSVCTSTVRNFSLALTVVVLVKVTPPDPVTFIVKSPAARLLGI